jgi:putative aminopeptidase FrvX
VKRELLKQLSAAHGMGGLTGALEVIERALPPACMVERRGASLVATLKGEGGRTILFDAHADEIGFVVTGVQGGFVRVAGAGGIDLRTLPAAEVVVHGKEELPGVFSTLPPHLKKGEDNLPDLADMVIDTGLEKLEELVSPGDRVTFRRRPAELQNGCLTGKSLDNRAGCAALLHAAALLAEETLACTVQFLFSDQEELGCLGAQTAAFALSPDEAVAVDVSFGDGPDLPPEKTGRLFAGPMIGVSPVLSAAVTRGLKRAAADAGIPVQLEAMGGKTSTNADVIALSKSGVPCGLCSIPLRNMHTAAEVVALSDVEAVGRLLAVYAKGGGAA